MTVDYDKRFSEYEVKTTLPCPPFGDMVVRHHAISKCKWLRLTHDRIMKNWPDYWRKMHLATIRTMEQYGEKNNFGSMLFEIHLNKSGGWIKNDVMFELIFAPGDDKISCGPFWVTAFSGSKVLHTQASY